MNLNIESMSSRDATIVRLIVTDTLEGDPIIVTSTSRRDPVDRYDQEVALNLAYGRAFKELGIKLLKRANGKMDHNDEMRVRNQNPEVIKQRKHAKKNWFKKRG